ncbi:MAG: chloride channel protein [Anaerolineae bacterium]
MVTDSPDPTSSRPVLKGLGLSSTAAFMVTAVLVGVLTSGVSIGFVWLIRLLTRWFDELRSSWMGIAPLLTVLIPALGGLAAGLLITYIAVEIRYGGISEVLQAIALRGSRLRGRIIWAKLLATALCIGTGGAAGRVGPIVLIGAALGSQVGQRFRLTDERIRNLAACGAAAGIATTFNAPIAGVIFALEVILGEFTETFFATIVISAVTSSIISRSVLGTDVAFEIPAHGLAQPLEILFYVPLGTLAALVAWAFIKSFYATRDLTERAHRIPPPLRPALGGLLLGALALIVPQVLGGGFDQVEVALNGQLALPLMAVLVVAKLVATDATMGTGSSGGVFAPALFMGAMLGGAFGEALHLLLPTMPIAPSGTYALVGMAAVFGAAAHAPMTALLIVFEMSNSYNLILPLMLATGLSTVIARALEPESIYTLSLARQGIHVERGQEMDVLQNVRVDQAMIDEPVTIQSTKHLNELATLIDRTHHGAYPVLESDGAIAGIVSRQDLAAARERWEDWDEHRISEIYKQKVISAYPDESVSVALQRMGVHNVGWLAVVNRDNPQHIVGIIHRSDVGTAYQRALQERGVSRRDAVRQRLEAQAAEVVVDLDVPPDSPLVGLPIRAVSWPDGSLIVAVHRDDEVLVGHGDVVIQPGDQLRAYARKTSVPELRALIGDLDSEPGPGSS